jgi:hypothetical protein
MESNWLLDQKIRGKTTSEFDRRTLAISPLRICRALSRPWSAVVQDDEGGRDLRTQPGVLTPGRHPHHEPALTRRFFLVLPTSPTFFLRGVPRFLRRPAPAGLRWTGRDKFRQPPRGRELTFHPLRVTDTGWIIKIGPKPRDPSKAIGPTPGEAQTVTPTGNRERRTANRYGVVDGTRTRNSWNHNPGLCH